MNIKESRIPDHPVEELILNRWSPRSMSGEPLTESEQNSLFEAARWAPSAFNSQPWRLVYAVQESPEWDSFFNLLADSNKSWCKKAAMLIVLCSFNLYPHNRRPSRTHSLAAGAAMENLLLQASAMRLVAHPMAGFNYDAAAEQVGADEDYTVEAMIAVGRAETAENLPPDLQERETLSDRDPLDQLVFKGSL